MLRNAHDDYPSAVLAPGPAADLTSETAALPAARRQKAYQRATKEIEHLIKGLNPGDRLPATQDLVKMLGGSRSSIRDAIRDLEIIGLIKSHQGVGTVVCEFSADSLMRPLTTWLGHQRTHLSQLLDFRSMLEPGLARQAAISASPKQIQKLEEIVLRQNEKVRRGDLAIEEDSEFHYTIAAACNNRVVLKVLDLLIDLLRETREQSLQVRGRPLKSLTGHRRILSAIKRHDATAAENSMAGHIEEVEAAILGELKGSR